MDASSTPTKGFVDVVSGDTNVQLVETGVARPVEPVPAPRYQARRFRACAKLHKVDTQGCRAMQSFGRAA